MSECDAAPSPTPHSIQHPLARACIWRECDVSFFRCVIDAADNTEYTAHTKHNTG